MSRHSTLRGLFGDTANSIKTVRGESSTVIYKADDFDTSIKNIAKDITNASAGDILSGKKAIVYDSGTTVSKVITGTMGTTSLTVTDLSLAVTPTVNPTPKVSGSAEGITLGTSVTTAPTTGAYITVVGGNNTTTGSSKSGESANAYTGSGKITSSTFTIKSSAVATANASTKTVYYPIVGTTLPNTIINGVAYEEATGDYAWKSTVEIPAGYHHNQTLERTFSDIFPAPGSEGTADKMLLGYQLYNHEGKLLTGTMPNNGSVSGSITSQGGQYAIPAGYHDGTGKVTASLPTTSRTAGTGTVTLTAGAGSVTVSSNMSLTSKSSQPTTGYYITGSGSGTVTGVGSGKVSTGTGYITSGETSSNNSTTASKTSNAATVYYSVPTGSCTVAGGGLSQGTASGGGLSGGDLSGGGLSGGGLTAGSGEVSITQQPIVTPSITGTGVGSTATTSYGITTTKPSGTDGTNFFTFDPDATYTQQGKAKGRGSVSRATITRAAVTRATVNRATFSQAVSRAAVTDAHTAGYIPDKSATTVINAATSTVTLAAGSLAQGTMAATTSAATSAYSNYSSESSTSGTVNAGTNYYIPISSATASAGSATATATVTTTLATVSSSSFTVDASASASATGGSASVSKGITSGANATGTGTGTKSAAKTVYIKPATASATAGSATATATVTSTGISTSTVSTSYYVTASASASATGGSASVGEGYTTGASATGSSSGNKTAAKTVYITAGNPAFDGGGLSSGGAIGTVTPPTVEYHEVGTFVSPSAKTTYGITTTTPTGTDGTNYLTIDAQHTETNGTVTGSKTITRASVLYNGAVNGYVVKADNTTALAADTIGKSVYVNVTVDPTVTDNFEPYYIPVSTATATASGGSASASAAVTTQPSASASGTPHGFTASTVSTSYYVSVNASANSGVVSASASGNGGSASSSVSKGATAGASKSASGANASSSTVTTAETASSSTVIYLKQASATATSGTASATATASVTGMVTTTTNTGYAVSSSADSSATGGSANVNEGYTTGASATGTSATKTASTAIYIQKGALTAAVSSNTGGSASMSATGFTPVTGTTTSYYVNLSTTAGSVKAKASVGTEGYVKSETNETAATSVSVSGNGNKVYIPAADPTFTGGALSITMSSTGPTTSSYISTSATDTGTGLWINNKGSIKYERSSVTYAADVNGYVSKSAGTVASAGESVDKVPFLGATLYISDIVVASGKSLPVTNNGTLTVTQGGESSSHSGTVTINAWNASSSGTLSGAKTVVSDGNWVTSTVTPSASAQGPYYGKVNVTAAPSGNVTSSDNTLTVSPSVTPSATASASGNNGLTLGTATTVAPTVGFYITSTGGNSSTTGATVNGESSTITKTAGWIPGGSFTVTSNARATANASTKTVYYPVATVGTGATITNGGAVIPTISRQAFTITGVTDAASGSATTTTPTTGIYVKVKSADNTKTLTATPKVTSAGYGTTTNYSATNATTTVGANASSDTYVPIKAGTITNNTSGGASSGTINRGSQIKIGSGYYPSDLYYTAQSDAHSSYVPSSVYFQTSTSGAVSAASIEANKYAASTYYVKAGSGAANTASVTATGASISLGTPTTTVPSTPYITVSGSGSSKITTAGWMNTGALAAASTTTYYPVTNTIATVTYNSTTQELTVTGGLIVLS